MKISRISTLQPLHRAFLQVNTELDALGQVLEWFDQFNQAPVPEQVWMPCQLALAEGFTNAVRHAHEGQPSDLLIDLEVQMFDDRLEIRIWDQGPPFDLHKHLQRMPPLNSDKDGGRGLRLMARIADILDYTRGLDHRNCLLMVRKYDTNPKG